MRILLLVHGFNSLSQRMFVELRAAGHVVSVEFDINHEMLREAVALFEPDVILAPYLKRAIPDDIWQQHLCLIVHPGVVGDRGPSALDWAILRADETWGVTVLQAEAEMDAGPIWASRAFQMRAATKSSLYRNEVADAALCAVFDALDHMAVGKGPQVLDYGAPQVRGRVQPPVQQCHRAIDWEGDTTATILGKMRASDGVPGLRDGDLFLHDGHAATELAGVPGEIIATSGPAICLATSDGAIWIGHLRDPRAVHSFKLPATLVIGAGLPEVPDIPVDDPNGYREISYTECGSVGLLRFNFYNGAMSTDQCERLRAAYLQACTRPTRVIVLQGGDDFWSNGIHLNIIEAAPSAADESWRNIQAMDDLAEAIIRTKNHLTIAAVRGNAGAGGVFLARACDQVWLRSAVVLNPHYKDMGNLYGSEFWTYLLPRYCGATNAARIACQRLPMGPDEAVDLGLADAHFGCSRRAFDAETLSRAQDLARDFASVLADKVARRAQDEAEKPLIEYRDAELARMKRNFFGFDPSYHVARYNFVHKICKSRTPVTLACHRDKRHSHRMREAT